MQRGRGLPRRSLARAARLLGLSAGTLFAGRTALELWSQRSYAAILLGRAWALHLAAVAAAAALGLFLLVRVLRGKPLASFAAWVGVACVVGTATCAYQFALFQPFSLLKWCTAFAQGFGAFCVLILAAPWAARELPLGLRWIGARILVIAAVTPPLLEIALRAAGRALDLPLLDSADMAAVERIERHRRPGNIQLGFRTNSRGFYDHEPEALDAAKRLVIAIGDSFSQGSVPHAYHFTTVAETRLEGVEIYSMGINAIGPKEYLYLLETEALPMRPEIVLIDLFVGNDVALPGRERGAARLLRPWFEREELMLDLVPRRLGRLREARRLAAGDAGAVPGEGAIGDVEEHSRPELERMLPWIVDPLLEPPTFAPETFLDIERKRIEAVCRPDRSYYGELFRVVEDMLSAAGETPLAFVLIPDEFQVEESVWEEASAGVQGELERFLPQRRISAWMKERGIAALDLLPRLRAQEPLPDGRRHLYHLRDTHFNARGNEAAGAALAELVEACLGGSSLAGRAAPRAESIHAPPEKR